MVFSKRGGSPKPVDKKTGSVERPGISPEKKRLFPSVAEARMEKKNLVLRIKALASHYPERVKLPLSRFSKAIALHPERWIVGKKNEHRRDVLVKAIANVHAQLSRIDQWREFSLGAKSVQKNQKEAELLLAPIKKEVIEEMKRFRDFGLQGAGKKDLDPNALMVQAAIEVELRRLNKLVERVNAV